MYVNKEESCLDLIKTVIKSFVHQTGVEPGEEPSGLGYAVDLRYV